MNMREKANCIINMPSGDFKKLLSDSVEATKSLKMCDKIMQYVGSQRPSDTRGNMRSVINYDTLVTCIKEHQTILTTKMVSLSILFANPTDKPHYFEELVEVFTTIDKKSKKKVVDYEKIAYAYNTTVDNVISNILFTKFKNYTQRIQKTR